MLCAACPLPRHSITIAVVHPYSRGSLSPTTAVAPTISTNVRKIEPECARRMRRNWLRVMAASGRGCANSKHALLHVDDIAFPQRVVELDLLGACLAVAVLAADPQSALGTA